MPAVHAGRPALCGFETIAGAIVILALGLVAIAGGALCTWLGVLASRKEKPVEEAAEVTE